ncbi:MAG TPA: hypothetical protein VF147_17350 [Vicinamibacterales bacterium]
MRRWTAAWGVTFTLALLCIAPDGATARGDERGAARFLAQREEPLRQYRAFRRMHARSERFNQEGWLEAWTELDEKGFRYQVVSERGSDSVRNKVLKTVLKREQELINAGDSDRADLTDENYTFSEEDAQGGERYVTIKPKRKDVLLVDGRMVLSQDGNELLRVEGRLAKNPSFWTSLVNVIRHYARLDGVRVPISTESTAKVKFVGVSYLDVQYDYESINGRPVSIAARRITAPGGTR